MIESCQNSARNQILLQNVSGNLITQPRLERLYKNDSYQRPQSLLQIMLFDVHLQLYSTGTYEVKF